MRVIDYDGAVSFFGDFVFQNKSLVLEYLMQDDNWQGWADTNTNDVLADIKFQGRELVITWIPANNPTDLQEYRTRFEELILVLA